MKKVRKALIPAAGLGTRFLPATKTVPKEMLPIVDKPIILYIVEECVRAGIEQIVLVAGRGKNAIEDFFDLSYEVEDQLERTGKTQLLERVSHLKNLADIISIRQKCALGLGHAVLCGRPVIGDDPFAVLLGDEIMITEPNQETVTGQLCRGWESSGLSTVAVMKVDQQDVSKYGIIDADEINSGEFKVKSVVEKPEVESAPSCYALPGRYVFDAAIFSYLENTQPGKNGEIQLTDAMTEVASNQGMRAKTFIGRRYDAGDKLGFLQANIELGLEHPELDKRLKSYLLKLSNSL